VIWEMYIDRGTERLAVIRDMGDVYRQGYREAGCDKQNIGTVEEAFKPMASLPH